MNKDTWATGNGTPSSIRVSITDHGRLPSTLRGRLERRAAELLEGLAYASDWADYRQRVGTIMGLTEAIDICKETERAMDGER